VSTTAPPATRKARCRVLDERENRCPNEALDSDPAAPQICVSHAFEAVKLLAEHGAITYTVKFAPKETQ
jgi:hypothetical protein